jgi:hypothetical protein
MILLVFYYFEIMGERIKERDNPLILYFMIF